jgi:predicted component of type VI protein secretion system
VIGNNRFISSKHCVVARDEAGNVTVTDFSSNGTFLNGIKLVKGQPHVRACHRSRFVLKITCVSGFQ